MLSAASASAGSRTRPAADRVGDAAEERHRDHHPERRRRGEQRDRGGREVERPRRRGVHPDRHRSRRDDHRHRVEDEPVRRDVGPHGVQARGRGLDRSDRLQSRERSWRCPEHAVVLAALEPDLDLGELLAVAHLDRLDPAAGRRAGRPRTRCPGSGPGAGESARGRRRSARASRPGSPCCSAPGSRAARPSRAPAPPRRRSGSGSGRAAAQPRSSSPRSRPTRPRAARARPPLRVPSVAPREDERVGRDARDLALAVDELQPERHDVEDARAASFFADPPVMPPRTV